MRLQDHPGIAAIIIFGLWLIGALVLGEPGLMP